MCLASKFRLYVYDVKPTRKLHVAVRRSSLPYGSFELFGGHYGKSCTRNSKRSWVDAVVVRLRVLASSKGFGFYTVIW